MDAVIAVSSRLGQLLRDRTMSVAELQRQLVHRYHVEVDPKTLYRLTRDEPIQRADVVLASAIAKTLEIGLDDLFVATDAATADATDAGFDSDKARRASDLFAIQSSRALSDKEEAELRALLSDYTRSYTDSALQVVAQRRGTSVDDVRQDFLSELAAIEHSRHSPSHHLRSVGRVANRMRPMNGAS